MKKLKQNLNFDCTKRFTALAKACDELGFDEQAAIYRKILKDAAASGIIARPRVGVRYKEPLRQA